MITLKHFVLLVRWLLAASALIAIAITATTALAADAADQTPLQDKTLVVWVALANGSGFQAEQRVDRDWSFGPTVRFRLLLKGSLCEFYINDLLIQCHSLPQPASGRIGLLLGGNEDAFGNLKAWRTEGPP